MRPAEAGAAAAPRAPTSRRRAKLPAAVRPALAPGKQLGPWFYAPALTAVVAPFAFGFLVGAASLGVCRV